MSSSTRYFAIALFTLMGLPLALNAQTPTKAPTKTPRGSVSGRITIKDKPAPGVIVGLRVTTVAIPQGKSYRGVTDHEGVYQITNVPPGTYEIAPAAPAYVISGLNGPRGKSVIVGDDEEVDDINFSMVRGGVITGKITDAEGRPLVQHQVYLYQVSNLNNQPLRQVYSSGGVQTDDRGIYRFFGLPAGRYKVACGRSDESSAGVDYNPSRTIYKQVFHPDVTDAAKATIIDVREGSEATNVDIAMGLQMQTFTVTGRVIDAEKGLPVPNIRFAFQRRSGERFEISPSMAVSDTAGNFTAEGLTAGKYSVLLFGNDTEFKADGVSFDVIDQDVTDVTVRLLKASSVSGVVVLEPEDKKVFAKLTELQLRGYVTVPEGSPLAAQTALSQIGPDGSFRLAGLSAGQLNMWLTAAGFNQPKGFAILRVEHNGAPMARGIEIKDGDQLTGVKLVVSYGTASLHGSVKLENGPLPEGARLVARLVKPGTPPATIAGSPVDARGQFLMEGIPPGSYELSIVASGPTLKAPLTVKREINVQDGVPNEFSITIDLAAQPAKP
jgi:protocatechuate 3,4-dioxygenase beta subunit